MTTRTSVFTFFSALAVLIAAPNALATRFANQFVEFELPMQWNCSLEGNEWVCQSTDQNKRRDAIIVFAAKIKGEQDDLKKYEEYLKRPRQFTAPNARRTISTPKYAKVASINGQPWVDALHLDSEIPGFFTRYLATVKEDIGILVTYSVSRGKYQQYLGQFDGMVKSLRAFRPRTNAGINSKDEPMFSQGQGLTPLMFATNDNAPKEAPAAAPKEKKKAAPKEEDDLMLMIIVGAIAVVGLIIYKRRKRGF